jgi:biofilm PGA synthesis N-glycosyltransferase PgaC
MVFLLGITLSCFLFYLGFLLRCGWYFKRIKCHPLSSPTSLLPTVSIVIPARNEAANLETCLRSVLHQNYPDDRWEVILVNDHSTDETAQIARSFQQTHPRLQVFDLPVDSVNAYKKAALSYGIQQAQNEIILQTDADVEMGANWLVSMVQQFNVDTGLVSGPVQLTYQNHWLQRFQALESMGLIGIGAGSIAAGSPNMCNGANLAYRKSVFESVHGYEGVDHIASGDDEFLLHKVHRSPWKLSFAKCPDAIVRTPALTTWPALKAQRLRWVSKARSYQNRWVNLVQMLSYIGFLTFPLLLLSTAYCLLLPIVIGTQCSISFTLYSSLFLLSFLLKLLVDYLFLRQMTRFFNKPKLLRYLLPLQFLYIPYVLWVGVAGNLVRTYQWKDRTVR